MESTKTTFLEKLGQVLPEGSMGIDEGVLLAYATDNSRLKHLPDCVAWPSDEQEVVAIVRLANEVKVPVYVRGRGSATTGSSLAEKGGLVLSTERMDKIVDIDIANRTATVQPGVITGDLAGQLEGHGFFWPPDPSSSMYSTVGGNLATAAAGPRGVRYGGVRENVLAVRAVCGDGTIVRSGAKVHKSSVGYDLARLLVGSEGSLAIITEATLRLTPAPGATVRAVASFGSSKQALAAVAMLMGSRTNPSAVEFLDEGCVELVCDSATELPANAKALLLLGAEGMDMAAAQQEMETIRGVINETSPVAFDEQSAAENLWSVRKVLSQRLREVASIKINEDVSVPVGKLAELVEFCRSSCEQAGFRNLNFGHAGLGNLHVNLLFDDKEKTKTAQEVVAKVMEWVVGVDGSISGEHGVGIAKRDFMPLQVDGNSLALMDRLKKAFDPNNILRPSPFE